MSETYEQATRQVASYVNVSLGGDAAKKFTDTELLAYINAGQRWVYQTFQEIGATQILASSVTISLPASSTTITRLTTPALPTYFISPVHVFELFSGSWAAIDKAPISLNVATDTRRSIYDWQNETLYFPAASQTTSIRLNYITSFVDFTLPRETMALQGVFDAVCYWAAADACVALEKFDKSRELRNLAQMRFDSAAIVDVHVRQKQPFRQRIRRSGFQIGWRW